jgi:hypothetical protein
MRTKTETFISCISQKSKVKEPNDICLAAFPCCVCFAASKHHQGFGTYVSVPGSLEEAFWGAPIYAIDMCSTPL